MDQVQKTPEHKRRFVLGILLVVEAALSGFVSAFAIPFAGVGLVGVIGAIVLGTSGLRLAIGKPHKPKMMAVQIFVGGAAALFGAFPILLFSQCGIMGGGCSRHAEWIIFGVPGMAMAMNAACAVLIWRPLRRRS